MDEEEWRRIAQYFYVTEYATKFLEFYVKWIRVGECQVPGLPFFRPGKRYLFFCDCYDRVSFDEYGDGHFTNNRLEEVRIHIVKHGYPANAVL